MHEKLVGHLRVKELRDTFQKSRSPCDPFLARELGTELLVPIDKCTTMACVRCPLEAYDSEGVDLFKLIWDRFGIVVPLIQMPGVAGSWARISAHIYNELADYEKLAEAVLQLKQEKPGTEPI